MTTSPSDSVNAMIVRGHSGENYPVVRGINDVVALAAQTTRAAGESYEAFIRTLKGELQQVQGERRELAGKVHGLTDQLAGSAQKMQELQAALQRGGEENQQLTKTLQERASQHQQLQATFDVAQREAQNQRATLTEYQARLETTIRRDTIRERLVAQYSHKQSLETELKTEQAEREAKHTLVTDLAALVSGVALALFTGVVLGCVLGVIAGKLISNWVLENIHLPWVLPLYTKIAAIQTKLRLANEEIGRLQSLLS